MRCPLAIVVLGLFALVLMACNGANSSPDPRGAWTLCQQRVLDRLKAPASAQFPSFDPSSVSTSGATIAAYKVASYVDSQNSFGAMLRTRYQCTVQWTGTDWQFADLVMEGDPTPTPVPPLPTPTDPNLIALRNGPGLSGPAGRWYPRGTRFDVLLVDSQNPGWLIVMAPDGERGYIRTDERGAVIAYPTPKPR